MAACQEGRLSFALLRAPGSGGGRESNPPTGSRRSQGLKIRAPAVDCSGWMRLRGCLVANKHLARDPRNGSLVLSVVIAIPVMTLNKEA